MKKILSFLCIIGISLACFSANATANETLSIYYDSENAEVSLSGASEANTVVGVIVKGNTSLEMLSENNPPVCFLPFPVIDGKYEGVIGLPDNIDSGKYTVYLSGLSESIMSDSFIYINSDQASDVIDQIKENPSDFIDIVEENAATLGVDTEDVFYTENAAKILELLDVIKGDYEKSSDLYKDIYKAYALVYVSGREQQEVLDCMKKYEVQLAIDFETFFESDKRITDKAKSKLCSLIANENYKVSLKNNELENLLNEFKAMAAASTATDGIALRKVIEDDFSDLFARMITNDRNYNLISEKNKYRVYSEILVKGFSSFDDLVDTFNASASKILKETQKSTDNSAAKATAGNRFSQGNATIPVLAEGTTSKGVELSKMGLPMLSENAKSSFGDVNASDWEYKAVSALYEAGIVDGYDSGLYMPDKEITRAEFTKLILSATDALFDGDELLESDFTDVDKNQWYSKYIGKAASLGLVRGGSDGGFHPDNCIKREDAAVIIYNTLKTMGLNLIGSPAYIDKDNISAYAFTSVGTLFKYKIMIGTDDFFRPADTLTRSEAAQLICNMINYLNAME